MSKTTPDDGAEADQDNEIQTQDQSESATTEDLVDSGDPQNSEQGDFSEDLSLDQTLEKLAAAQLAAEDAKDDLLRVQAEMQNLRRRTEQDIEKAHKYGQEKFSIELLSVMDNLERALTAASEHEDDSVKAIYDGVDLTLKSFVDCFSKFNIETLDPLGEPFDPQIHQAMGMQENPDVEPNTVIAVMQKGYTLYGRVIRPAMVMVAKGTSSQVDEEK
jgi:molecular chaperone GrpE|tara:strand:+ start:4664 stop:5314 length:651 start_codon:yes stop_codon:yes gene_type:complete